MKIKTKSPLLMVLMLLAVGLVARFEAKGQNEYYPATENEPAVLDHIVKAKYLDGEGYEGESRRKFKIGKSEFSVRIKNSGGYWYVSVYQGFKATISIKNPRGRIVETQPAFYEGKHKLNIKSRLWEVTGLLEGEMSVEKTVVVAVDPKIHLPPKIKTKPFPKPLPKSKPLSKPKRLP